MTDTSGVTDTWARPVSKSSTAALLATEHQKMPSWESTPAKTARPGDLFRHVDHEPATKVPLEQGGERKGLFGRF
ncbi:MAG: hypothetical protein J0M12_00585 [Deltaproteobacteria bacterium]|nr:hypothetical protein [Deltaproteobacteria bacterium]